MTSHLLWSWNMVPMQQPLRNLDALISGNCVVHSEFLGGPASPMRRPLTYWATSVIRRGRLKFSGYIVRANPSVDHNRALQAWLNPLPTDCRNSPPGSPCHTWLQMVDSDLAPVNAGLATAYHRFQNRQVVLLVGTVTFVGQATWWRLSNLVCPNLSTDCVWKSWL